MDMLGRRTLMEKFADLIKRDAAILAKLESMDNGRVFGEAFGDAMGCWNSIKYFAGWVDKIHGETLPVSGSQFAFTKEHPVGVCG